MFQAALNQDPDMLDEDLILKLDDGTELEIATILDEDGYPVPLLSKAVFAVAVNENGDYERFRLVEEKQLSN